MRRSAGASPTRRGYAEQYKRQIKAVDGQIDALVYGLYGLTDDEIKTVEAAR